MIVEPLHNNVVVNLIAADQKTKSGLYVPEIARDKDFARAEVLAAGPGLRSPMSGFVHPLGVKAGDVVMVQRKQVVLFPHPLYAEDTVGICPENAILGVIHGLERGTGIVDADGKEVTVPADHGGGIAVVDRTAGAGE